MQTCQTVKRVTYVLEKALVLTDEDDDSPITVRIVLAPLISSLDRIKMNSAKEMRAEQACVC